MRRLAPSEHLVLTDACAELEGQLTAVRRHADRARQEGRQAQAYIDLDHARSALGDLVELAGELDEVLAHLVRLTGRETKPRGRAPKLARDSRRASVA